MVTDHQEHCSLEVQLSICAQSKYSGRKGLADKYWLHVCMTYRHRSAEAEVCIDAPAGQVIESDGSEEAAEAVENLLESYFMQIDGTYDRLVSIGKGLHLYSAYSPFGLANCS